MDDIGVWKTVSGRRIFIKEGQSLESAMTESGKFNAKNQQFNLVDGKIEGKMQKQSDDIYKKFTEDEDTAMSSYVLEGHQVVNAYLDGRYEFPPGDFIRKMNMNNTISELDNIISKYNLQENIITFRGASANQYKNYDVGDTFKEYTYTSTSLSENIATFFKKDYMVEIRLPKNSKGLYIGKNTIYEHEKEFLISRNTNFKVIEKTSDKIILEAMV